MSRPFVTVDGNEAVASVAHRTNEVIAIYPITPSSSMGELSDEWSAAGRTNIWGTIPQVIEMQSEAGAIGAVHGALQAGSLSTTFTSSQGLLLMIPNLFKIAGELTAFAMHVAARTVATHALSIFGDHSDVMACRQTGVAMLASASVQEAHDFALIAQAATLRTRIPFIHFFDGFRTSHEVARIEQLTDDDLRAMIDDDLIAEHRRRALSPDHPVVRGTAQNPDVFFQAREASNLHYMACPALVQQTMNQFAALTGRQYKLFEYVGDPTAEHVIVIMGSGADTAHETVDHLRATGARVGVLKVRLYRPFSAFDFLAALPPTVRSIGVLDRTKEPGSIGEPLYLDVLAALEEARATGLTRFSHEPRVIGGRYGLSSKEFTPSMVKTVFDNLASPQPKTHFTVGITDDLTYTSLEFDPAFSIEPDNVFRAVFFGLGADGTVGANKNTIKIIGEETDLWPQGYFVYDSKKSGALTISHLRFGPTPLKSAYLIREADFVGCHQTTFLERYDVLGPAKRGAVLLLNAPYAPDDLWSHLPRSVQQQIVDKQLKVYTIDAYDVAEQAGMGRRINTIMQTCFFAISGMLPRDQAIDEIRKSIKKTYGRRGDQVVQQNFAAVDATLANLHEVPVPDRVTGGWELPVLIPPQAPDFVRDVTAAMLANHGDDLPVSAFPLDGTWPVGTAKWEKRNIAQEIPAWDADLCIQCNKCALICPHAAIRAKVYPSDYLSGAPATFKAMPWKGTDFKGQQYSLQVAPEDCTGCTLCVAICPAKDKANPAHRAIDMVPQAPLREAERANFEYFLSIPEADRTAVKRDVKSTQLLQPLMEFSGACSGCGETPYLKLLTQLFGDRLLFANATGCSSIFGGNLPTTPFCANPDGRGPAWSNSLFEDNAEFGFGFRLAIDSQQQHAQTLVRKLADRIGAELAQALVAGEQQTEAGIQAQRQRGAVLREHLRTIDTPEARALETVADALVSKSVWIVGGDGWAYDIGFGGLDHVMAMGRKVNILVMDTEVYSNTGGQASKATPLGAAAKFAANGKSVGKKDLGLMAISYGSVYVARVAIGAKDAQTLKVLQDADSFPGTSIVIAYAHCIAHGFDIEDSLDHQRLAVETGYWPLFRYDPRRRLTGENPFQLDSSPIKTELAELLNKETRFTTIAHTNPERFQTLLAMAQEDVKMRFAMYEQMAKGR